MSFSLASEKVTDRQKHSRSIDWRVALLRLGLVATGALLLRLATHVAFTAPLATSSADIALLIVSGLAGLSLIVAAGLRRPPHSLRWLILLALIGEVLVRSVIWAQTSGAQDAVTIDSAIYADLAGELFRHGENPYEWDMSGALNLYRAGFAGSSPRLNAAIVESFPYPALAFLLPALFQGLGLPGAFSLSVAAYVAVLILIFIASPRSIQPLVLIPTAAGFVIVLKTLQGSLDIIWVALLVGMVVAWRAHKLRAVLFGLSLAVKQMPWLLAPFLIVRIWRDEDAGSPILRVGQFAGLSTLTFLIVNALFIFDEPEAWLRGITAPLANDMVLLSEGGLSSITHLALISLPKSYYLLATVAVLGLLLFCYWRHYQTAREAVWILPGIFMWFSYRTLTNYWVFWIFPLLAAVVVLLPARDSPAHRPSWIPTIAAGTAVLTLLFTLGRYLSSLPATTDVQLLYPLLTAEGRVVHMEVAVTNYGDSDLGPRFAIQRFPYGANPRTWHIEQGPPFLGPGQTGTYRISTNQAEFTFGVHDVAQVVVTDAGGDYSKRGVATIEQNDTFFWPDAIPNPEYLFWDSYENTPNYWRLVDSPSGSGKASLVHQDDREILKLELEARSEGLNQVALENWISLPSRPFGIWLYWDPPSDDPTAVAYGLEIDDGEHLLWLLYGGVDYPGPVAEGHHIIHHSIPPRTWVYQEIDIPAAYAQAGWQLPELELAAGYRGLDVDLRMVSLRLLLAAKGPRESSLEAYFGHIEQENYRVEPQALMKETFDDPVGYHVRLANSYLRGRNYDRALEAYERALQFSPGNPELEGEVKWLMQRTDVEEVK